MNINDIKKVMVVGAGTMGHSIAQVYSQGGLNVILVDLKRDNLDLALRLIESNLDTLAEFNKVDKNDIPQILKRIDISTDLSKSADNVQLVVEAVNEVPEVKKSVYTQLDKFCNKEVIIASNTSGLNVFEIAEISNPERLIIHHWFAPPHIIPLVEIAPGPQTSPEIITLSENLLKKLGKRPVVLKEFMSSFIVNRLQNVMSVMVYEMISKGLATAEQIDTAVKTSLGIRLPVVGVVQTQDFTGLDLVLDVQKLYRTNKRYPQVEEMVNQGHLGAKTGKGWYDYGGRSYSEILKKRDRQYLKLLTQLEKINAFEPV